MAGIKQLVFDPKNIYSLLVHYTDGLVPLEGEVKEVLIHPKLSRFLALSVESDKWESLDPLHIRYDGQRISSQRYGRQGIGC